MRRSRRVVVQSQWFIFITETCKQTHFILLHPLYHRLRLLPSRPGTEFVYLPARSFEFSRRTNNKQPLCLPPIETGTTLQRKHLQEKLTLCPLNNSGSPFDIPWRRRRRTAIVSTAINKGPLFERLDSSLGQYERDKEVNIIARWNWISAGIMRKLISDADI